MGKSPSFLYPSGLPPKKGSKKLLAKPSAPRGSSFFNTFVKAAKFNSTALSTTHANCKECIAFFEVFSAVTRLFRRSQSLILCRLRSGNVKPALRVKLQDKLSEIVRLCALMKKHLQSHVQWRQMH